LDAVWAVGRFAEALAAGAREAGVREVEIFGGSSELAAAIPGRLRSGDLVLVKGSRDVRMERVVEAIRQDLSKQS
jgi:UDP-N-acetylmuramoyl-tripeptide--D-alanyl-D-alanine ligase